MYSAALLKSFTSSSSLDFNNLLTSMDKSSRQKNNKETATLNETLHQMHLIDILRALHGKAAEYTYFSCVHALFYDIEHMLGNNTSLNKFKKTEIVSSIFSDHNAMKPEINQKKKIEKCTKTWNLITCY